MTRRLKSPLPLVSVVLPTYNRARLLPHAIRSVLAQTHDNLELIIVDDNSPDDTADVVHSFRDPRIRYVRNDPNLKLPRALNRGFSMANGELLTWTSDDNMFMPEAVEKMVARLQKGDCDFTYADYYQFCSQDEDGKPMELRHERLPDELQLEKGNHIGACFLYTRRLYEAVGDYDPELFLVEDYDYFLRSAKRFNFCHIAEPLYYFRRDEETLYYSRFCEVKASDVLVRCKNGVLSADGASAAILDLLSREPGALKNPLLRGMYRVVDGRSYRLTRLCRNAIRSYLEAKIGNRARNYVLDFEKGNSTFGATRDALCRLMQETVELGQLRS